VKPVTQLVKHVDIMNGSLRGVRYSYTLDKDSKVVDVSMKSFDEIRAETQKKQENPPPADKPEKVDDK
jgi:hypothetical protein